MTSDYDIAIIGAGPTGYGAALYAGRFKLKTLLIGKETGGALNWTGEVDNYPGLPEMQGIDLADKIKEHALKFGAELKLEEVENIERKEGFEITTNKAKYSAKSLVIATGTERKKLGIPGEEQFEGNGIHSCAICDGYLYNDKEVAVIGGSDAAVKEAIVLAQNARKVYIIYRRENLRAEPVYLDKIEGIDNIEVITKTQVKEAQGTDKLEYVVLDNPYKGSNKLPIQGLFIEIGHTPLTELAKKIGVELNDKGEIIIDRNSRTNVKGVFAAGDVTDTEFKQAITGVAQGVTGAYMAFKYIKSS
ncbi:MAG: NAD(P)/FAD-dependent oxidoreductase [Candidatus Nanoarchaeia archaeon]